MIFILILTMRQNKRERAYLKAGVLSFPTCKEEIPMVYFNMQ